MTTFAVFIFCCATLIAQAVQIEKPKSNSSKPFFNNRLSILTHVFNEPKWDQLQGVVLFVGSAKTGKNLVGSILNAHPKIMMGNEYNLLSHLEKKLKTILHDLHANSVMHGSKNKVQEQWQGSLEGGRPNLIGDNTVITMHYDGKNLTHRLKTLANVTKLPLKLVHIGIPSVESKSVHNSPKVKNTQSFLNQFTLNPMMLGKTTQLITLDLEAFTTNPVQHVPWLCTELKVDCSPAYVQAVSKMIWDATDHERANW